MTETFIPLCESFKASWDEPGKLTLSIQFRLNPFVQTAIVILSLSALAFALLLSRLRTLESLATATASYFLSLWSIRGIVDKTILSFPTLFDMWLLAVAIAVLVIVIVTWRSIGLTDSVKPGRK